MGGKTMLYKLKENKLESIAFEDFGSIGRKEKELESIFAQNLEMIYGEYGILFPIFQERQWKGEPDLCALDKEGNLIIFEFKCSDVPEGTTNQIMRYAEIYGQKSYDDLNFIYKNYSNALIMEVDIENDRNDKYYGYTEVDIIHNRIHKEILFDSNGNWYSTSWEVHKNELPETVRNVIEKQYKEYNLDDAEYIEKANDTKYYRIDLELGETDLTVNIDSDGNVIP